MTSADLLVDAFGRVREDVHRAVDGLSDERLAVRIDAEANSIGWLVWHLTRVEDDHVADAAGLEQVWTAQGWADRFGLPFEPGATGYGQTSDEVGAVRVSADLLAGYQDAVHEQVARWAGTLTDDDLPRVVDETWGEPVTVGVRLVSVLDDCMQHAGQAAFVRGVLDRT